MPPLLGRKRKTSKGAGKYPAVENFARHSGNGAHDTAAAAGRRGKQGVKERENPLWWRNSLGTRWKMPKMPPPPGRRGTRRDAAAGEEGTRGSGARKYIAVKDLAPLLSGLPQRGTRSSGATKPTAAGDVARLLGEVARKNRRIRGFRSLSVTFVMSSHLLEYVCTFSILGCCRMGVVEYAVLLGWSVPLTW